MKADVAARREAGASGPIPADAVTTSASGLDPDISPQTRWRRSPAVAKARGLTEEKVRDAGRGASRGPRRRAGRRAARQCAAAQHGAGCARAILKLRDDRGECAL